MHTWLPWYMADAINTAGDRFDGFLAIHTLRARSRADR